MALQNAFALGTCSVRVMRQSNSQIIWQGNLSPGQSSPTFSGVLTGEVLQAIVNNDGTVQLNWTAGSNRFQGYQLAVIPSYSMASAAQLECSGFTLTSGIVGTAYASGSHIPVSQVFLTGSGSAWTPDPADITATGKDGFYVYEGATS